MKRFLVVFSLLFPFVASSQNADTTAIMQYRLSLDTARHMPASGRAAAYWNAAKAFASQEKWDTAAKAFDKSMRFFPIDSTFANAGANDLVVASRIEQSRSRTVKATDYAVRAMTVAQRSFSTDSLVALSAYLQELYAASGNVAMVWRYKYFSDSLRWTGQNRMLMDSVSSLGSGLSAAAAAGEETELQLAAARDEIKKQNNYLLWLAGAAALLLIGLVAALLAGRNKTRRSKSLNDTTDIATTYDAVHRLTGLNDLMLQRGRTGDDLVLLKAMERELQRLWKQSGTQPLPAEPADEDRVMRQLKGIRILIFSDNADASFILKNWLRKQIRLCDIQTTGSFDSLPADFQPHAVVYDALTASDETLQRLSSLFPGIPVVVSAASPGDVNASVLQKPHALSLVIDRLMKAYRPAEEVKIPEPVTVANFAAPPAVDIDAIGRNCNLLEEAYAERNGDKLIAACYGLMPLFEQANSPATKWLKLLAEPPENISEVQVELAYRNVIAYCRKAAAS